MNATKIGIWMDHEHAFVTEFTADDMKSTRVLNESANADRNKLSSRGENRTHTKERQLQSSYYNRLSEIMSRYENVVLFGPTTAKNELFNKFTSDPNHARIRLHIEDAGKMTQNQRHAFVRDYFANNRH